MTQFSYELKIPQERVAVLIGKSGEIKKNIEADTKTQVKVDSLEGDIFVYGEDALGLYTAREIIRAIGRGFNPEIAKLLLKQDYVFEYIELNEYTGKSKNTLLRLKGRVIGKEGKSRRLIEELSEAYISVYGKSVCIIGTAESAAMAKRAVEALLKGSTHASVYKWLENKRREMKRKRIIEMG
jgi:ribosomal RNA assembly protein